MRTRLLFSVLALFTLFGMSCSSDSEAIDPTDSVNPDISVPDPVGTISISMRNANSGGTYLENTNIHIDKADNFVGAQFVSMGAMKGLGSVTSIPKTGWSGQVLVKPGNGYVAYASGKFYRMYVSRYITNVVNEILGAEIKYQSPFGGADEAVSVVEQLLNFECEGGTKELMFTNESVIPCTVESANCKVSVLYNRNYSFLPEGVKIIAEKNDLTTAINGKVIFNALNGHIKEVPVTIKEKLPYIDLGADISVGCAASTEKRIIRTNIPVSDLLFDTDAEWCEMVYQGENILELKFSENTTDTNRIATIVVSSNDATVKDELIVNQNNSTISVDKTKLEISALAQETVIGVNCMVSAWKVDSDQKWCSVTKQENKINVVCEENEEGGERHATIVAYVDAGKKISAFVHLCQAAHPVSMNKQEIILTPQAQTTTVAVTTTASEWLVESNSSWCQVDRSGNEINISVDESMENIQRTAKIAVYIDIEKKTKAAELIVRQNSYTISVNTSSLNLTAISQSEKVFVSTLSSVWFVESDQDWCKIIKSNGAFEINIDENNEGENRTATILVYVDQARKINTQVIVRQSSHSFGWTIDKKNFDREAHNLDIKVNTTASKFSATSSENGWCTISGYGNNLTLRLSANNTGINRKAKITLTLSDNRSFSVDIEQARYKIGDCYNENNVKGIIFELLPEFHGLIVSLDESGELQWSKELVVSGATSDGDGMKNTEMIEAIPDWRNLYPAFLWCDMKNTNGVTGWYFPSLEELNLITVGPTRAAVNNGLASNGGVLFNSPLYWTSTENSASEVYCFRLIEHFAQTAYYTVATYEKNRTYLKARAVYAF